MSSIHDVYKTPTVDKAGCLRAAALSCRSVFQTRIRGELRERQPDPQRESLHQIPPRMTGNKSQYTQYRHKERDILQTMQHKGMEQEQYNNVKLSVYSYSGQSAITQFCSSTHGSGKLVMQT